MASSTEKVFYAWVASVAAFASPVSTSIYYPALTVLAKALNTSLQNINLSITTYMIFQALAPTFVGGISDRYGRRPAYFLCFVIYIAANTGLALQSSYVALLILRMIQSSGSSGTISLSNGVVSDVSTRSERGKYIGIAALGSNLGPTLGPLIGGLLVHFQGWRAIFWFLDIYAVVIILTIALFIPETCRNIVGNGGVPPQRWNVPLISFLRRGKKEVPIVTKTLSNKRRPSLIESLHIARSREAFCLILYSGLQSAGYFILLAGLPSQLETTFHYNSIQVGLCYIPMGAGILIARQIVGRLIDFNFRRHAKKLGVQIVKNRQTSTENFPVERARLEVGLPLAYLGCVSVVPYGWVMRMQHPPLPLALFLLFCNALSMSGSMQCLQVLLVDCHPESPSSTSAAANLIRCLLSAGGVALVEPLLNGIGRGWTGMLISAVYAVGSLLWWAVWVWGAKWRGEKERKLREKISVDGSEVEVGNVEPK
ncbi:related to dityrosine transporter [Phialocephala subalpina]|uniref:Related to dityrosine transporter n=1 Tax=Phialocephala subalpina TaxID=576137 RepID=A0A1L7WIU8_9HELO|nr:related to dityrosine transporter [Phialocephala subalpina]